MKNLLFSILLLFFTQVARAQITVISIALSGNLKTQNDVILRELSFEENKSYSTAIEFKSIDVRTNKIICSHVSYMLFYVML